MASQRDIEILGKALEISSEKRRRIAGLIIDLIDFGLLFIKNPILKSVLKIALRFSRDSFGLTYDEFVKTLDEAKLEVETTGVRQWLR